jgi:hypothetical protein
VSTGLHLPDVSEFQGKISWPLMVRENGGAAVIRALYGADYQDKQFAVNRRNAHAAGVKALGIYQYLRADQDALMQAKVFVALVGKLSAGEFAVLDLEEGSGDQAGRAATWLNYVDAHLSYPGYHGAWVYSYLSFIFAHNLLAIFQSARHTWVADYTSAEPFSAPHSLWQHSNGTIARCSYEPWSGVGYCDCSQFDGTLAQLLARIYAEPPAPKPSPNWTETMIANLPTLKPRQTGAFVKRFQGLLVAAGYKVAVDGDFGPATSAALTALQEYHKIDVKAEVTEPVWQALITGHA